MAPRSWLSSLKVTLNTIYSRDLAYLSWKLQGVEGWDGDRLQIKRSPCLRLFTKIRFSIRRIASCSPRPSGWPLLTRWFTQTRDLQTMTFSCSVCECQANTQSKLAGLEVGNWMIAVLTSLWMMPCSGRREWELVNTLHWEEETEPLLIFILSRQMNSQKCSYKRFNREKQVAISVWQSPCQRRKSHPEGPSIYQDLSPSVPITTAYIKPAHTPKHL